MFAAALTHGKRSKKAKENPAVPFICVDTPNTPLSSAPTSAAMGLPSGSNRDDLLADAQRSALHACVARLGASELLEGVPTLERMVRALEDTVNILALESIAGRMRQAGSLGPCAAATTSSGVLARMEAAVESLERTEFDLRLRRVNERSRQLRAERAVDPTR